MQCHKPPFFPGIVYRILMIDFHIAICCTTVCTLFYFINLTMSLVVYNVSNPNAHRFSRKSDLNTNPKSVFQFATIKCPFYISVLFHSSTNENCLSLQYCGIWIGERHHCSYRDYKVLPSQGKWHVIFIRMTLLLCETIVQSTCAVGDHVFSCGLVYIFISELSLCWRFLMTLD
jgi:hypothetical protein